MRSPANWSNKIEPALVLLRVLALHAAAAHGSRSAAETSLSSVSALPAATEVCESRTINYITHTLPQQCLRTSWTSPTPVAATTTVQAATPVTATTVSESPEATQDNGTLRQQQDSQEELAASSFMSFEEWKEMMLRKSGQDPAKIKNAKQREHHGERDPGLSNGDLDSFGEEGEISLDFDALTEKVSELTSSPSGAAASNNKQEVKEEQVLYDDGKTQYYRSKDAGKTCKERFSYASFDAGATVLKTSPGAKNAKAILVENKDSYMLMECRAKDKFVIVELSDDILVDTVVLANFEFFSSMIRKFRVSASDRYPVKMDKWVDLGTFEARNSRDIQAFLVEHPQIYTKYIRIEFLSHYGNEFYCPVSLLRVHGTRMLDTWKETSHDDEPEQIQGPDQEPAAETPQAQESPAPDNSSETTTAENITDAVTEMCPSPWQSVFQRGLSLEMCPVHSPTTAEPTPVESVTNEPAGEKETVTSRPAAAPGVDEASEPTAGPSSMASSAEASPPTGQSTNNPPSAISSAPVQAGSNSTANHPNDKQTSVRTDADGTPSSSITTTVSRNKTSSTSNSPSASPTVQESFFKTVNKRLQLLESNTSLSLQYIEEQSRFLQDVLLKIERKQIARVDAFLDSLNKTVLSELRNVRTQYDQIWQSTVIALETQREQSEREIVALTSRLNVLADEVVFQKRMAILQSVLLLSCLVLVIFSRGGLAALDSASFAIPNGALASSSYRRYGSLSGPSTSSPPPAPLQRDAVPARSAGVTGPATEYSPPPPSAGTSTALAASALPRHLYSTSASASASALRNNVDNHVIDKTLPLTPSSLSPSEYGMESPPPHLDSSEATSFNDDASDSPVHLRHRHHHHQQQVSREAGAGAGPGSELKQDASQDAEASCTEVKTDTAGRTPPPTLTADQEGRERPPLGRTRSTLSQLSGLRKPLPALPEDPS
ncbi:hypothetical protein VTK56DRAFT_2324 [Thermocarpiscus australiensis]